MRGDSLEVNEVELEVVGVPSIGLLVISPLVVRSAVVDAIIVELRRATVGNDVDGLRKLAVHAVPCVLDVDAINVADDVAARAREEEESAPVVVTAQDLGADGEHQLEIADVAGSAGVTIVDATRFLTCSDGGFGVGCDRACGGEAEEKEEGDDGEGELDRREMHFAISCQQVQARGWKEE